MRFARRGSADAYHLIMIHFYIIHGVGYVGNLCIIWNTVDGCVGENGNVVKCLKINEFIITKK